MHDMYNTYGVTVSLTYLKAYMPCYWHFLLECNAITCPGGSATTQFHMNVESRLQLRLATYYACNTIDHLSDKINIADR